MTRLYQWNNNTYQSTKHLPTLLFVCDIPEGVRCECGFCNYEVDIKPKDECCPQCQSDLIFPRCDW